MPISSCCERKLDLHFVYGATGITAVAEYVAQPSVGATAAAIFKSSSGANS